MVQPRVYAVSESEPVAETLAIMLEPACDYRWIPVGEDGGLVSLPRPALLIDACTHPRGRERATAVLQHWPGVPTLRLDLLNRPDPNAARRAVAAALDDAGAPQRLDDAIRAAVGTLHADLKPRLVAARILLVIAARQSELSRQPAWRTLCREQLLAIAERSATVAAEPSM